jgi:hypothetical protein
MRLALWVFGLGFVGITAALAGAGQDDPKKDEATSAKSSKINLVPGPFRMFVAWDKRYNEKDELNRTGKLHDPVGEHGLSPVLAAFSRTVPMKPDGAVGTLVAEQDRLVQKYRPLRFAAFTAFLTLAKDYPDDSEREVRVAEVTRFAQAANPKDVTIGVAEATVADGEMTAPSPQVATWKIGAGDDITVVFYYRFEVLGRWAFTKEKPPGAVEIDEISSMVDKVLGPKLAVPKRKK